MSRVLCLVAISIGLTICHVSPPMVVGRPREGLLTGDPAEGPTTDAKYMIYSNITQKVDHFSNGTNIGVWQQVSPPRCM